MCSLFGLIDYGNILSTKQKNRILNALARSCECRGTDATGIAYNLNGRMRIYKRPLPAHKLKLHIPNGVHVVMGNTRMTTQGSEKRNCNNHPFLGRCHGKSFALAHNGVLWNDRDLQLMENLPETNVETDSFVAVQLLEKQNTLDFPCLKEMAEKVEGSFVFTVLDHEDSIFVVKGDNPFVLYRYDGFLFYASTKEILEHTAKQLDLGAPCAVSEPEEGDVLKIDHNGRITIGSFIPRHTFSHWWRSYPPYTYDLGGVDSLFDAAKSMGVSPDEVQALLDYGCDAGEIEELLYDPALLHEITNELLYAY